MMSRLKLFLIVVGSLAILAGCELDKDSPASAPQPPPPPPADVVSTETVTPTADRLIFSSGEDEPDLEVYTTFRNGSGRTRLTHNLRGDSSAVAYPNTGLVYYTCERSEAICVSNTTGTANEVAVSASSINGSNIMLPILEDPAISPDGSQMLFTGVNISDDGKTSNNDIYLYDFSTDKVTNFAVGPVQDQMPAWASDTEVVWSRLRNGDWDLVTFTLGGPRGSAPIAITDNNLDDLGVDVSGDGEKLSFMSIKGNDGSLVAMPYTKSVGTPTTVGPVTLERGFIGGDPDTAWSPDGTRIAYAAKEGDDVEIFTIAASGGAATNVTKNSVYDVDPEWATLPPSFSVMKPASFTESNGSITFDIVLDAPSTESLTVDYATVGGTATPGADFTPKAGTATFSPGQTKVSVQVNVTDDTTLEVLEKFSMRLTNSAAGTLIGLDEAEGVIVDNEVEPTPTPTVASTPTPSASPSATASPGGDGRIAFTSTRGGAQQLYTMAANGSDVVHVSTDQASSTLSAPSWSPTGARIIHTALNTGSAPPQPEIMDRPSNGSGSFRMLVLHASMDTDPDYRHGSTSTTEALVWASDRDGDFEIYYATPGGTPKKLTNNSANDGAPSFSGDGKYIVYHSNADGDFDIYRLEVAANGDPVGTPANLTNEAAGEAASDQFHPDYAWSQNKIVYHSNKHGDFDIFVMNVATKAEIHVTHEATDEYLPSFSPSGNKVVFVRDVGGNLEIFTATPTEAAASVNITNNAATDSSPDWGPI